MRTYGSIPEGSIVPISSAQVELERLEQKDSLRTSDEAAKHVAGELGTALIGAEAGVEAAEAGGLRNWLVEEGSTARETAMELNNESQHLGSFSNFLQRGIYLDRSKVADVLHSMLFRGVNREKNQMKNFVIILCRK